MNSPPNLDELEAQVQGDIESKEPRVLVAIEEMLNRHLDGFQLLGSFTPTYDNRLEFVWMLLWNRSFNSMRWAFHLLKTGYYSQSLMLTRGAFEDWLVCEDCKSHPETRETLLNDSGRLPRFQVLADRLEEPLKNDWNGTYGLLSSLSHPRHLALAVLLDPETNTLRLGPCWDESLFIVSANYLLLALIRMVEFMMALVSADEKEWGLTKLKPSLDEAIDCANWLLSRAESLQEET